MLQVKLTHSKKHNSTCKFDISLLNGLELSAITIKKILSRISCQTCVDKSITKCFKLHALIKKNQQQCNTFQYKNTLADLAFSNVTHDLTTELYNH